MAHTIRDRDRLLARARRLKGQVTAVERALESQHDCADILQQLAAIRGAANGLMAAVLEGHVRGHLGARAGPDVDVLVDVLRRYLK